METGSRRRATRQKPARQGTLDDVAKLLGPGAPGGESAATSLIEALLGGGAGAGALKDLLGGGAGGGALEALLGAGGNTADGLAPAKQSGVADELVGALMSRLGLPPEVAKQIGDLLVGRLAAGAQQKKAPAKKAPAKKPRQTSPPVKAAPTAKKPRRVTPKKKDPLDDILDSLRAGHARGKRGRKASALADQPAETDSAATLASVQDLLAALGGSADAKGGASAPARRRAGIRRVKRSGLGQEADAQQQ